MTGRPKSVELSPRQREIMALRFQGAGVTSIADTLGIEPTTVKHHIKRAYARFGAHSLAELKDKVSV